MISPQQLHNMIQLIKTLPDNLLIRVIRAATVELLDRSTKLYDDLRKATPRKLKDCDPNPGD